MQVAESMGGVAASMSAFFTPTVLFCVLNLVIGTIFITSPLRIHERREEEHHNPQYSGQRAVNSPHPPQLLRSPSLLDRVKSFNFSSFYHRSEQPDPFHYVIRQADPHREREQAGVEETANVLHVHNTPSQVMMMAKSKSETATKAPHLEVPAARMKEAPTVEELDRGRPATMRERNGKWTASFGSGGEDDEAVDKKADDFINWFREQLKLQRLDSLSRYKLKC